MKNGRGIRGAVKEGEDIVIRERKRGVIVEAEAFAGLITGTGGHGRVSNVEFLSGIVYVGHRVASRVRFECQLIVVTGEELLVPRITAASSDAKRVPERNPATASQACLGGN